MNVRLFFFLAAISSASQMVLAQNPEPRFRDMDLKSLTKPNPHKNSIQPLKTGLRGAHSNPSEQPLKNHDDFIDKIIKDSEIKSLEIPFKRRLSLLIVKGNTEKTKKNLDANARNTIKKAKSVLASSLNDTSQLLETFKNEDFLADIAISSLYDSDSRLIFSSLKDLISGKKTRFFDNIDQTSKFSINSIQKIALESWLQRKVKQTEKIQLASSKSGCINGSELSRKLSMSHPKSKNRQRGKNFFEKIASLVENKFRPGGPLKNR